MLLSFLVASGKLARGIPREIIAAAQTSRLLGTGNYPIFMSHIFHKFHPCISVSLFQYGTKQLYFHNIW